MRYSWQLSTFLGLKRHFRFIYLYLFQNLHFPVRVFVNFRIFLGGMVCHFPLHSCQCVVQSLQHLIGQAFNYVVSLDGWRERATCLFHTCLLQSTSFEILISLMISPIKVTSGKYCTRQDRGKNVVVLHILIKSWISRDT